MQGNDEGNQSLIGFYYGITGIFKFDLDAVYMLMVAGLHLDMKLATRDVGHIG